MNSQPPFLEQRDLPQIQLAESGESEPESIAFHLAAIAGRRITSERPEKWDSFISAVNARKWAMAPADLSAVWIARRSDSGDSTSPTVESLEGVPKAFMLHATQEALRSIQANTTNREAQLGLIAGYVCLSASSARRGPLPESLAEGWTRAQSIAELLRVGDIATQDLRAGDPEVTVRAATLLVDASGLRTNVFPLAWQSGASDQKFLPYIGALRAGIANYVQDSTFQRSSDGAAVDALMNIVDGPYATGFDAFLACRALQLTGVQADAGTEARLRVAAGGMSEDLRQSALGLLWAYAPSPATTLSEFATDDLASVRYVAARNAEVLAASDHRESMLALLVDPHPWVRAAALNRVMELREPDVERAVRASLKESRLDGKAQLTCWCYIGIGIGIPTGSCRRCGAGVDARTAAEVYLGP